MTESTPDGRTVSRRDSSMTLVGDVLASARQLLYPPQFRIHRPQAETTLLEEADSLLRNLLSAPTKEKPGRDDTSLQEGLVVRVATGLWRLRQRMIDPLTKQPKDEMRRAYRHVESLWDTLGEFGVEIQDHGGEAFDSGMALVVLSYEQDPAVTREVVKETVKPTIYLRERCIQRGEVIVASPPG